MTLTFKITGGMYPYEYRSTAVKVTNCVAVGDGYPAVRNWCQSNFPDCNHISVEPKAVFHVATINAAHVMPVYFGIKRF